MAEQVLTGVSAKQCLFDTRRWIAERSHKRVTLEFNPPARSRVVSGPNPGHMLYNMATVTEVDEQVWIVLCGTADTIATKNGWTVDLVAHQTEICWPSEVQTLKKGATAWLRDRTKKVLLFQDFFRFTLIAARANGQFVLPATSLYLKAMRDIANEARISKKQHPDGTFKTSLSSALGTSIFDFMRSQL